MIKIFVVILNWNRKEDTLSCIKSCIKLNTKGLEVNLVVVDNASTDDSVKAFEKVKGIELLVNKKNLGFAEGNNIGMKYAISRGADYVLVLNNDTEVDRNLVVQLVKAAEKNLKGGAFSPKIYFAKGYEFHRNNYKKGELGKVIWAAGGVIDWANVYGKNIGVDEVDHGQFDKLKEVDFASGACVLYRVEALRRVGLYDTRYFMYYEDVEISTRMKKKRWKTYYVPDAVLWHKVAQSSAIGGELNDYFITRNRLLFGMKYASIRTKFALIREAFKFLVVGRKWQKMGAVDYMTGNLWKGSWK